MARKATTASTETKPEAPAKAAPKLVKMVRDEATADVHPAEVENYRAGGWQEA